MCFIYQLQVRQINNIQIDDANDIDVLIPIYNLVEYSDIYLETSRT